MRIVAGSAGGRKVVAPEGTTTRPTTERVREAMFNALYSLDAIDGATFVDLFAGSGALGLEALSRGAGHVVFIERDRGALAAIEANVASLGFGDVATIVSGDALRWLQAHRDLDVALADPPYDFAQWDDLLVALAATTCNLVVVESDNPVGDHSQWRTSRERKYGSTVVTMYERLGSASGNGAYEDTSQ